MRPVKVRILPPQPNLPGIAVNIGVPDLAGAPAGKLRIFWRIFLRVDYIFANREWFRFFAEGQRFRSSENPWNRTIPPAAAGLLAKTEAYIDVLG
jgi:hypothetical protein